MRFFLAIMLGIACGPSLAQEEKGTIAGAGWMSCADFAQRYQQDPQGTEAYFFAWAQGFISGANQMSFVKKNVRGWTNDKQKAHIRSFCNDRPLAAYGEAVSDVYINLPNR